MKDVLQEGALRGGLELKPLFHVVFVLKVCE